jgi:chromosome segregation ATPase
MDEVKTEVEKKAEDASTQKDEVKKEETVASPAQDDLAAKLAEKDAEIARLAADRDNYKKGLLVAKGKLPAEEQQEDQTDIDSKIQTAVHDALFSEKEKKLQAEKDALFQQALRENAELKVTLKNKQGMSDAPSGTSSDSQITTTQYFNNDQIRDLKARGWDDAKIKKAAENMRK